MFSRQACAPHRRRPGNRPRAAVGGQQRPQGGDGERDAEHLGLVRFGLGERTIGALAPERADRADALHELYAQRADVAAGLEAGIGLGPAAGADQLAILDVQRAPVTERFARSVEIACSRGASG